MKCRRFHLSVAAFLFVAAAFAGTAIVAAQAGASASKVAGSPARVANGKPDLRATPRLPNGKPDLSGMWVNAVARDSYLVRLDGAAYKSYPVAFNPLDKKSFPAASDNVVGQVMITRRPAPNQLGGQREATNEFTDFEFTARLDPNRPLYKPQFWDKVQNLDYDSNFADPVIALACHPRGVPRMGPPTKIVQTADEVIFLYQGGGVEVRVIPTDGRAHDPKAVPTYKGDAVGHWEGDTLVVDVTSFNDITWIASGPAGGGGGYFHGYEMHVIERLRRDGDRLHYQATVEDPEVLLEPWAMNAVELKLNPNPKAMIDEGTPCDNSHDLGTIVGRTRH